MSWIYGQTRTFGTTRAEINHQRTPPRHGDVHDRAEEEEEHELEQAALHDNILRQIEVYSAIVEPIH
ncbi:MAG: hypothetical protein IIA64_12690 [Planctomycetes bacterium]|nr:hypothetical protein [Planctomycetota bacterium]